MLIGIDDDDIVVVELPASSPGAGPKPEISMTWPSDSWSGSSTGEIFAWA